MLGKTPIAQSSAFEDRAYVHKVPIQSELIWHDTRNRIGLPKRVIFCGWETQNIRCHETHQPLLSILVTSLFPISFCRLEIWGVK